MNTVHLYTDGGARGNPGPAGIGAALLSPEGETIDERSKFIDNATNNYAEYTALIEGLDMAKEHGAEVVHVFMDSELVVKQMKKEYRVRDETLARLFVKVWNRIQTFKTVTFTHVPRAKNKHADRLVNEAIDRWA